MACRKTMRNKGREAGATYAGAYTGAGRVAASISAPRKTGPCPAAVPIMRRGCDAQLHQSDRGTPRDQAEPHGNDSLYRFNFLTQRDLTNANPFCSTVAESERTDFANWPNVYVAFGLRSFCPLEGQRPWETRAARTPDKFHSTVTSRSQGGIQRSNGSLPSHALCCAINAGYGADGSSRSIAYSVAQTTPQQALRSGFNASRLSADIWPDWLAGVHFLAPVERRCASSVRA
jgi:hypothetical protein